MLREKFYPQVSSIFNSWANALNQRKITPNQVTVAGAVLSLIAGFCFANSALFFGALWMGAAGICDALDGPLARLSGKESSFGAFFDSTLDRFADGFLCGGLVLHFFNQDEPLWIAVTLGLMIASFGISYTKARAENFIEKCSIGVFTRETRFVALLLGVLLPFLLKLILLAALLGSAWTVYQRILYTYTTLKKPALADSSAAV